VRPTTRAGAPPSVDTRAGALAVRRHHPGDAAGAIAECDIAGDLADLCRGVAPGRRTAEEITLFKSVGTAIEDLAAAILVHERLR
jgi:ornithine cyclodeaminase